MEDELDDIEPPVTPPDWIFEPTEEFYGTFGEGWKPEEDMEIVF